MEDEPLYIAVQIRSHPGMNELLPKSANAWLEALQPGT